MVTDTSFKYFMNNIVGQCTFTDIGDTSFLFSPSNKGFCEHINTNAVLVFYSKVSDSLYLGNIINLFDSTRSRENQSISCSSFFVFPLEGTIALCPTKFDGQRKYRTEKEGATFFEEIRIYNDKKNLIRTITASYHNIEVGINLHLSYCKKDADKYYSQQFSFKFSEILTHKKLLTSDRDLLEIVKYAKEMDKASDDSWEEVKFRFKTFDYIVLKQ